MGSKSDKVKKHKRHHSSKRSKSAGPPDAAKLLRYAVLGKTSKLRELLANPQDWQLCNTTTDSGGATPLHQAARHGQLEAVELLLRRAADPSLQDSAGNTPAHLAAMQGHLLVLTALVKAAEIDLDQPNAAGLTIRQIVQQQGEHQAATSGSRSEAPSSPASSIDSGQAAAAASRSAASRAAAEGIGSRAQGEEDDWLDKLAYEMSYDDGGGFQGAWGGAMAAAAAAERYEQPGRSPAKQASRRRKPSSSAAAEEDDNDEDDAWADRLWQDMQEHRRQAAAAAAEKKAAHRRSTAAGPFSAGSSRQEAAEERERKAAAAAAESARILQEEQAKDADWRAAMMRQVEEAALPVRRSTYEERWQRLEAWPAGKPITYMDVPWPCPTPGSQAAARKQQQQLELQLDAKQLQTLVLAGAKSAAEIKLALRKELMRWHPDKFTAKFGSRLAAADKDAVDAGVHAVAQQLTALKQQ